MVVAMGTGLLKSLLRLRQRIVFKIPVLTEKQRHSLEWLKPSDENESRPRTAAPNTKKRSARDRKSLDTQVYRLVQAYHQQFTP